MGKRISLTVDERVVLHLMDFIPNEEDFEAPEGSTQAGIANGVGIERKHVPRAVNKLIDQKMLETRVSHVKGSRQRKKVYFLSFEGKALARRIWKSLASKEVEIIEEDGGINRTTFSELCFTHQVGKSPVAILNDLVDGNVFDPKQVQEIRKKEIMEENLKLDSEGAKEIYKKALTKAWEDQILTRDEESMLKELRTALSISEADHRKLQEEILDGQEYEEPFNKKELYDHILQVALRDGVITRDERDILEELKKILGIRVNDNIPTSENLPDRKVDAEGNGSSKEDHNKEIYRSVLKESLRDGKITRDEQNILIVLKRMLDIQDEDHLDLLNEMKGK
ncbi:MAG: hypothetical protein ACMUIG_03955 [Thermoplasmatota archaeon]